MLLQGMLQAAGLLRPKVLNVNIVDANSTSLKRHTGKLDTSRREIAVDLDKRGELIEPLDRAR